VSASVDRSSFVPATERVRAAVMRFAAGVWGTDRTRLPVWASGANRALRLLLWAVRGMIKHRLSVQAAAMTYHTAFSVAPVLAVALWVVKELQGRQPGLTQQLIGDSDGLLAGNPLLHQALTELLRAVQRTGQRLSGVVGLAVVLYGVLRLFVNVEQALGAIAGTRDRNPPVRRARGYLVLLAMPALLLAAVTAVLSWRGPLLVALGRLMRALPGSAWVAGTLVGLASVALGLGVLYTAGLPARIGHRSVAVGAVIGAILLGLVLWVFVRFQIGVGRSSALFSGLAAVPVYLLWVFVSWYVVLVGAEIAVGHDADRLLSGGARVLELDAARQQAVAVAILERAARAAAAGAPPLTIAGLSRQLALFPGEVQAVCERLCDRGLLADGAGQYRLGPAAGRADGAPPGPPIS